MAEAVNAALKAYEAQQLYEKRTPVQLDLMLNGRKTPTGSIASAEFNDYGDVVKVTTEPCCVCKRTHEFILDAGKFRQWQDGEFLQDVFPGMTTEDREILISGTCDECFDKLFGGHVVDVEVK